jgi:hypothetical protein
MYAVQATAVTILFTNSKPQVSSARLVTSYPVPPQSSFTCPPCSLRRRIPGGKDVARYTYVATKDPSLSIALFKDIVEASGKTIASTKTSSLSSTSKVVYLTYRLAPASKTETSVVGATDEVLAVRENGEIIALDSESLQQKWKNAPSILQQDLAHGSTTDFRIDTCVSSRASEVIEGVFKGNQDALSSIISGTQHATDPELLLAVSSTSSGEQRARHLHILGPVPHSQGLAQSGRGLVQLHVVPIVASSEEESGSKISYRLDARSGTLTTLSDGILTVYDLAASLPRVSSQMNLEDATSFVRLSKTSILTATPSLLNVYNPQFQSMQSSTAIEPDSQGEVETKSSPGCMLVAYFSRLELAIGISGTSLLAIQLEAPKSRTKKRRAEGLLIDSIGRGVPDSKRVATEPKKQTVGPTSFSSYLPGSMLDDYLEIWTQEVEKAEAFLEADAVDEFEAMLAEKFGVQTKGPKLTNGVEHAETNGDVHTPPEWVWPEDRTTYPRVDRRWIIYSISKVFHWSNEKTGDVSTSRLECTLPYTNVLTYLVDAGHLTLSNVKSALRDQLTDVDNVDHILAEELVTRIAELDATLELLAGYVTTTTLGSVELLLAVRTIMRSLELVKNPVPPPTKLVTNETSEDAAENGDIGMELDHLEEEVFKAESILNGNMGIRGTGLSVAFAKLNNCPATSTTKALRTSLKPEEILSLVYLLRIELVKGAWTSRYLDNTDFEEDAEIDAPPDGIIKLLADLLSRCVDSIGPGGWLLNDAILAGDDSADFIASLKLEVSAALEGLEEAAYLKGVVGETLRYCEAAQKSEGKARFDLAKPISLQVKEPGAEALPLGLKAKGKIEKTKVVSGGEIVERSAREKGHIRSQQVGLYSLERIAI